MSFLKTVLLFSLFSINFPTPQARADRDIAYGFDVIDADPIAHQTVALVMMRTPQADGSKPENIDGTCTGVIIDDSHILSAGHCVNESPYGYLIFSATNAYANFFKDMRSDPQKKKVTIPFHVDHFVYSETGLDYAVLSFAGGLPAGYTRATLLPHQELARVKRGQKIECAGYGRTETDDHYQIGVLRKASMAIHRFDPEKTGQMELMAIENGRPSSGDSGGPAFVTLNGKLYLLGLANYLHPLDERGDEFSAVETIVYQEFYARLFP